MNRRDMVQVLYLGGRAAIIAELVVILGGLVFALLFREVNYMQLQAMDGAEAFEELLQSYEYDRQIFALASFLVLMLPAVAMLFAAWAFHLYFAYHGARYLHWVATSIALIGATLMIATGGMNSWGLPLAYDIYAAGTLSAEELYPAFIVASALRFTAVLILYNAYPLSLVLVSFRRRLLPLWFMVFVGVAEVLQDAAFFIGNPVEGMEQLSDVMSILLPFMMGVVLLRKAESLAHEELTGTPTQRTQTPEIPF
jgi:uncharacterized membrane protein